MLKASSNTDTSTSKSHKPHRAHTKKATEPSEPLLLTVTKHGRKVKAPAAPDATPSPVGRLNWTDARIERAIEWCEENPEDRQKLFSDSTQAAKDQSRRKLVSKTPKAHYHQKIANHVFSVDEDVAVRQDFRKNPTRYTKSVDNLLTR